MTPTYHVVPKHESDAKAAAKMDRLIAHRRRTLLAATPELYAFVVATLAQLNDMTTEAFSRGADKPIRDAAETLIARIDGVTR